MTAFPKGSTPPSYGDHPCLLTDAPSKIPFHAMGAGVLLTVRVDEFTPDGAAMPTLDMPKYDRYLSVAPLCHDLVTQLGRTCPAGRAWKINHSEWGRYTNTRYPLVR